MSSQTLPWEPESPETLVSPTQTQLRACSGGHSPGVLGGQSHSWDIVLLALWSTHLQGRKLEPLKLDYRVLAAVPSAGSLHRVSSPSACLPYLSACQFPLS